MKSKVLRPLVHLLVRNSVPLYYFYEIVVQHAVHYDRNRFRQMSQFRRIPPDQYRRLQDHHHGDKAETGSEPCNYPLLIEHNPWHIRLNKYFFLFITIRSLVVICFKQLSSSKELRIITGTEVLQEDSFYIETTILLWSCICYLFFQFTLTSRLLEYKFLALFQTDYATLKAYRFGLSAEELRKFIQFRRMASFCFHLIMYSLVPFSMVVVILLFIQSGVYQVRPILSFIWTGMYCYWVYIICAVLYSNLIAFIVVANYVHLKQRSIATAILGSAAHLQGSRVKAIPRVARHGLQVASNRFMQHNLRYSHLQDELCQYVHFWRSYLSYVFVFYVLLICFILYLTLFAHLPVYINAIFSLVLYFHVVILSVLIYFCGAIVCTNQRLSHQFGFWLARCQFTPHFLSPHLKVNNMGQYLHQISKSGFHLLNGYLITFDTFRFLLVNIAMYFLLIIKK